MNINSISNFAPIKSFKQSNKQNPYINLSTPNDIFIKSPNISFKGKSFEEKYSELKKDLTDYIMTSPSLEAKDIEGIIQKYSPTTTFDDYKNFNSKTSNAFEATTGYTKQDMTFAVLDYGVVANALPQKIYVTFPKDLEKESRILFGDNVLHECSHVLQNESSNRQSYQDFFNSNFRRISNTQCSLNSLRAANETFCTVEQEMYATLLTSKSNKLGHLPKKVSKKIDLNEFYKQKYKCNAKEFAQTVIALVLRQANAQGAIDKQMVLDFVILKAQNEKEAYRNALDFDKEQLKIKGAIDLDLKIKIYDSIINAAQSLK